MEIAEENPQSEPKFWRLSKCSFRTNQQSSSSSTANSALHSNSFHHSNSHPYGGEGYNASKHSNGSVSSIARSFLPTMRRLRFDPPSKLFFPYEPGKKARSVVRIKNTSKSLVAFKFQTTVPKSCFMRPPGAILAPGESLIATDVNY